MKKEIKLKINKLAQLFYQMQGYNVEDGYDFSEVFHPQEKLMWNQAIVAYSFVKNDTSLMKYQV